MSNDRQKITLLYVGLSIAILLLGLANLFFGSVTMPIAAIVRILCGQEVDNVVWETIVLQSRIPQMVTAILSGGALAVAGLMLQTLFHNPLADSSILGISAGANLGVALVMLSSGGLVGSWVFSFWSGLTAVLAALTGALFVLVIILYFSIKVRNNVLLLIIGIMVGYIASSAIAFLNFFATANRVQSFVMWGMGDFSSVTLQQLPLFSVVTLLGIGGAFMLVKPLNALLLGERYAANLGIKIKRVRWLILLCTSLLTAVVTAYCGPISFIGLAVPHIARLLLSTSNHRILLPVTALSGAVIALLCNLISTMPGYSGVLPLNVITPLLGTPVILYVILNRKNIHYFN